MKRLSKLVERAKRSPFKRIYIDEHVSILYSSSNRLYILLDGRYANAVSFEEDGCIDMILLQNMLKHYSREAEK